MFLLPQIRERKMNPFLKKEKEFYTSVDNNDIEKYQLKQFNKQWEDIQLHVEFYKKQVDQNIFPKQFETFDQFKELPIVTRDFVNENMNDFTNTKKEPESWGTTGGS